jgi:glycosyltransferase involved in cell wall biosynthesis
MTGAMMGNRQLDVSVVIPCFNAGSYLAETLRSVLGQTFMPREILVVDDGSTDDSAQIASSFGGPVRVLQQKNQGESVARNVGIDAASGKWVAFLDADDIWEPTKLEEFDEVVRTSSDDLVCVHTDFYYFDENNERTYCSRPEVDPSENLFLAYLENWQLNTSTAIVLTDLARAIRFPESVQHSEDMIFFAQVVLHGKIKPIRKPLAGYRRHARQQTKSAQHHVQSILSRLDWLCNHPRYGTPEACQALRVRLGSQVAQMHSNYYWRRDWGNVKNLRKVYSQILPTAEPPSLMKRRLPPAFFLKWKDRMDSFFKGSHNA